MTRPAGPPRPAPAWLLLAAAALTALTLTANLTYLARSQGCEPSLHGCPVGNGPWMQPDSLGYMRLARQIRAHGFESITYERRTPGYPALMAGSLSLTGAALPTLWLTVPAGALAAAAVAWLATLAGGGRRTAAAAGGLFAVWPAVHAFAPLLLTDALHAFLCVTALAATLAWRDTGRAGWALAAAAAWMAAQTLRPNFFLVAPLLAILLYRPALPRRTAAVSAALCCAALLVPVGVVASNWVRVGVAAPSIKVAYAAACESVPKLRQRLGEGNHFALREECRERQRELAPAERMRTQNAEAIAAFAEHPFETAHMLFDSGLEQLLYPSMAVHRERFVDLYPAWLGVGSHAMALFWVAAFAGLLLLARSDLRLALFLAATFALVMGPGALVHTAGSRYRLPIELLFLPLAVAAVGHAASALVRRAVHRAGAQE